MTRQANTLLCIVKGDRFQAAHAAADRGIAFVHVETKDRQTVGYVPDVHTNRIVKWFCEDNNKEDSGEYPTGTLLYYK